MTRSTDLAYIAGIFDGEACIRVKRTSINERQDRQTRGYHAMIHIHMVDEPAIKFIAETLGGWYYPEKPHSAQGRPLYRYQASDKRAEEILRALLPYLRVKREAALNVLALRDLQADNTKYRTKITGYRDFPNQHGTVRRVANKSFSDEYVAMCDAFFLRSKELNQVGDVSRARP